MKELILNIVDDLIGTFLYYDRQEDEDLPKGVIEASLKNNEITIDEIVDRFKQKLIEGVVE